MLLNSYTGIGRQSWSIVQQRISTACFDLQRAKKKKHGPTRTLALQQNSKAQQNAKFSSIEPQISHFVRRTLPLGDDTGIGFRYRYTGSVSDTGIHTGMGYTGEHPYSDGMNLMMKKMEVGISSGHRDTPQHNTGRCSEESSHYCPLAARVSGL
jgi:hypothetical protein